VKWTLATLLACVGCSPTPPVDAVAVRLLILCGNCPIRVFVVDEGNASGTPDELEPIPRPAR
jgi:hypothetical protein